MNYRVVAHYEMHRPAPKNGAPTGKKLKKVPNNTERAINRKQREKGDSVYGLDGNKEYFICLLDACWPLWARYWLHHGRLQRAIARSAVKGRTTAPGQLLKVFHCCDLRGLASSNLPDWVGGSVNLSASWLLEALGGGGLLDSLDALDLDRDHLTEVLRLLVEEAEANLVNLLVVNGSLGAHGDGDRESGCSVSTEGLLTWNSKGLNRYGRALRELLLLLSEGNSAAIVPDLLAAVAHLNGDVGSLAWHELEDILVLADEASTGELLADLGLVDVKLDLTVSLVPLLANFSTELLHLAGELLSVEVTGTIVAEEHELLQHSVPAHAARASWCAALALLGGLLAIRGGLRVELHLIDDLVLHLVELRHRDALGLEHAVESIATLSDESLAGNLLLVFLLAGTAGLLTLSGCLGILTSKLDAEDNLRGLALDEGWDDAVSVLATILGEVVSLLEILLLLNDDPTSTVMVLEVLNLSLLGIGELLGFVKEGGIVARSNFLADRLFVGACKRNLDEDVASDCLNHY